MKVAITGASGFLGSHCLAVAVASGHEVRAVVRNPAKARSAASLHGLDAVRHDFSLVLAGRSDAGPRTAGR